MKAFGIIIVSLIILSSLFSGHISSVLVILFAAGLIVFLNKVFNEMARNETRRNRS